MARIGRTDTTGDRNSPNAGPGTANHECQLGGHSTLRETKVLRRWRRMEKLEYRLSKLCVCLLCTLGITLGTNREIGQHGAQRHPYSGRGLVFHAALLHAGHAVLRDSSQCPGGPGSLESSCFAPRTDLVDAQREYVARAPELQVRRRDFRANGPVRSRHRPLREKKRRELPEQHPYRSCFTHAAVRSIESASCPQQCQIDHLGNADGRNRQRQTCADCCQFNTAAHGPFSVWYPGTRCLPEGQPEVARQEQRQKKNKPRDDIPKTSYPICGKTGHWKRHCWHNEANLKSKGKGKDDKGKSSAGTQQQPSGKGKKGVKCWSRTYRQGLSEEEAYFVGCGESNGITQCDFFYDRRNDV